MLISLLVACNTGSAIEGVWALLLPPEQAESCETSVTHNFLKGSLPTEVTEESEWQSSTEEDSSGSLVLVDVRGSSRIGATLVVGDRLLPGERTEDGSWDFDWIGTETRTDTQEHAQGYSYLYDRVVEDTTRLSLQFDGDIVVGTWEESAFDDREWTETDTWSEFITEVGETGSVPSSTWLVSVDDGSPVSNTRTGAECTTAQCVLRVTEDCSGDRDITGFLTGYEDDDAYDHLAGTGQPEGT